MWGNICLHPFCQVENNDNKTISMKYTFLLPAYKAKYLNKALESIKCQTFADFKVVISDDCSPENLHEMVLPYLDDARFSYRRNEKNIGGHSLVEHWNLLVNLCDTEFFIMASDDDVYEPNFLEELDKLVCKYPTVDLFHARAQVIDGNGEVTMKDALYEEYASQMEFMASYGNQGHVECVPNYIYRTERMKQMGGFVDFPLAWCSDTATNNLMAQNGCATSKEILFSFRMSGANISSISKEDKSITLKKLKAAYLFYGLLQDLFDGIAKPKNKLQQYYLDHACQVQVEIVKSSLCYFSTVLGLKDFLRLVKFMRRHGMLQDKYEIMKLLAKWWYAKRHQKY